MKSYTILEKDVTDAAEVIEENGKVSRPKENIINDDSTAKMSGAVRVTLTVQGIPFVLKDAHHGGVEGWSVAWSEGHDTEGVLFVVGAEERKFLLVAFADENLVVAGFIIQADKEKAAGGITEVIDGIITSRNGVFERKSDSVKSPVRNAHAPNKIFDIGNVFLVGFCCEDNGRSPRPVARLDPSVVE